MSTPRPTEGISIRAVPLAVFALILLVPFLNFEFALYRSTLKLFVFQTATTLLWGYLAWEWAAGRLHRQDACATGWPAWWLFAPVGAWVAWGAATALWSRQGWLATGWVVQGAYGAAGALGLALLLRDAGHRRMFVAAASAVAGALAFLMLLLYGDPGTLFFGDIDHLPGPEAGAAFLLLPTLVAAALLYRHTKQEAYPEAQYGRVIWLAALFVLFLLAGLRTALVEERYGWRYGIGAGLLVFAWLVLPRWRLVAVVLALALAGLAARRELTEGLKTARYADESDDARNAVLDTAEWRLVRQAPLGRLLAGNGVGTFRLELDAKRGPWTYAVTHGDVAIGHARRQLTEDLFERGVVGLALGVAMGLAWVVAGVLAFRRARDPLDSALGAGLAAAGVALGAFACFSNGAIGFGPGMVFWVGLGLLGALSAESGRPAGLSWSAEEEAWRGEVRSRWRRGRTAAAVVALGAVALTWLVLAARPFWAEYCLRDGLREHEAAKRLFDDTQRAFRYHHDVADRMLSELPARRRSAEDALRAAAGTLREAMERGADGAKTEALAAKWRDAAARLDRVGPAVQQGLAHAAATIRKVNETIEGEAAKCEEAALHGDRLLRRAARLSLGDRVWLDAEIGLALSYTARGSFAEALDRCERLDVPVRAAFTDAACSSYAEALAYFRRLRALCGPAFDFDVQLAECHAALGRLVKGEDKEAEALRCQRFAGAHRLYSSYADRNPLGALCTTFNPRVRFYEEWHRLIADELARKNPDAVTWASGFIGAAAEGLKWRPGHYGLLLLRGDILYWLRQPKAAREDVAAASAIIDYEISQTRKELGLRRASLYLDLANANLRWDPKKAIAAANAAFLERVNWGGPQAKLVQRKLGRILSVLGKPMEKPPKPPDTKAPAPPKAQEGEPGDTTE